MRLRIAAGALIMLATLAGCASSKDPRVSLVSASPGSSSEIATTLRLWLHLENDNDIPLELLDFEYQVNVDGQRVYEGRRSAQMTLAMRSTRDIEIPAVVNFGAVGWTPEAIPQGANVQVRGTLRYVLPGAIAQTLFDTGVRRPRASFQGEKPLTIEIAPATQPASRPAALP